MRSKPFSLRMVGSLIFFSALLWTFPVCLAQAAPATAKPAPVQPTSSTASPHAQSNNLPDYSKEAYIVDKYDMVTTFQADGTWQQVVTVVVQVKSQAGILQFGNISIPYESRNQKANFVYIRIRKPDGSVLETPAAYTQDTPAAVTLQAPMYSDLHIKQVPVTNLSPGDTLEYQFKIVQFQALIPNQFWFAQNFFTAGIALEEDFQVRVPTSQHVQVESTELQPTVRQDGKVTVYDWKTSHLHQEPTDRKSLALKADAKPSIQLTTFQSWQQVGEWYRDLESSQVVVTPAIRQEEQQLTQGLTTDDAKQRAIYAYVATQFRYIGLSFGIGRYQPHTADKILENKFGDCKDKHTLFAALMKAAGYDVWPVLINSSAKLDATIPYPGQFDHVISLLHQGNSTIWLDTTEEVAPYGMLAHPLRDKMALVIPTNGPPVLEKTPMNPPFAEDDNFTMKAVLDKDVVLTGHADLTTRGDLELGLRSGFHLTPEAEWTKLGQNISYLLGFSGDVTNVQADNPDNTSKPFHISYDYTRKDYGGNNGTQIVPPLPAIQFALGENDPQTIDPINLGAPGVRNYSGTIELPKGDVVTLPANADIETPFAEYRESASVKDGTLYTARQLDIKVAKIPVAQWQDYLKFEKAVLNRENQWITVSKGNASLPATASRNTDQAGDLIGQAIAAINHGHNDEAKIDLDQARKLNPTHWSLWNAYAFLDIRNRQPDKAIEDFQREIANHPDNTPAYQTIGDGLMWLHRPADAEKIWRSLLKVDPSNEHAKQVLGGLLVLEKHSDQALPLLQSATHEKGAGVVLQEELALAELEGGQQQAGIAGLEQIMRTSQDPQAINTAAYLLTKDDADIPEAAAFEAKALRQIENATAATTLATLNNDDLHRVFLLGAIWDTVGWIDFKQAKYSDAERYVRSAWLLSQNPDVADHLSQIYRKESKLADALHMDELASAAHKDQYAQDLLRLRTVQVSGLPRTMATAQFWLLFTPQGLADVKWISGDRSLETAAPQLKKAKYIQTFPDPGPVQIVRRAILSCSHYTPRCQLVFLLPQWVHSVTQ